VSRVAQDPVESAQEAAARRDWHSAYALLTESDREHPLGGTGLLLLADAALWTGRAVETIPTLERAYAAYVEEDNPVGAATAAILLAHYYSAAKNQPAVANGWLGRAKRLVADEPEGLVHGYLALEESLLAFAAHEAERTFELAGRAEEIGRRLGDRSLEMRGLQRRGMALVVRGDVAEGRTLLDEAGAAAVGGELDQFSTLAVYCNTIGVCRDAADYDRAREWTDLAHSFCSEGGLAGFPGMCRVNHAEILKFKGQLREAEDEAGRAGEELREWSPGIAGAAFYELGDVRLRLGDFDAAEQSFREADEYGSTPEPGLSLLRLAQGSAKGASVSISRALADDRLSLASRARLLPAAVEIALANGEVERAEAYAEELAEAAETYETSALKAVASFAAGSVRQERGETAEAFSAFREARRLWDATGATYDVARARERLGLLARAEEDEETALWELQAAAARFERLEAVRDAERVAAELGRDTAREVRKTFLFTDIVKSTELLETMDDRQWATILRRHDDTLRAIFRDHSGQVVDHTGDGFFVAFDEPGDAVQAAQAVQRAVDQEFVFDVRIGVHTDGALQQGGDYRGRGVHAAARGGAAAEGREILVTTASVRGLDVGVFVPRTIELKGLKDPVEVASVEWAS
jgi:class 3 adenylate cyclase